jgi:hypothetical protein
MLSDGLRLLHCFWGINLLCFYSVPSNAPGELIKETNYARNLTNQASNMTNQGSNVTDQANSDTRTRRETTRGEQARRPSKSMQQAT